MSIILYKLQQKFEELQNALVSLNRAYECGDNCNESQHYNLIRLFGKDASQAIALLSMVNFNGQLEQKVLLPFFPVIVFNMPTFIQQFIVIEHFKELQNKFPQVDFSKAIRDSEDVVNYY